MTALETSVLRLLSQRVGRTMALKAQTIANEAGVPEREAREVIKSLIEVHHVPIAATVEKPYGYFMPASIEEGLPYAASLKSRIRSDRQRLDAYEAGLVKRFGPQMGLGI